MLRLLAFLLVIALVFTIVLLTVLRLMKMLSHAKSSSYGRINNINQRIKNVIVNVFAQSRVAKTQAGVFHALIFWGFIVMTLGAAETFAKEVFPFFDLSVLGDVYYGFIFIQEVFTLLVIAAVLVGLYRRLIVKPARLQSSLKGTIDGTIILVAILLHSIASFLAKAGEIAVNELEPEWAFASNFLYKLLLEDSGSKHSMYDLFWWIHTLTIFIFIVYIVFGYYWYPSYYPSKHMHIFAAVAKVFVSNLESPTKINVLDLEDETIEVFGAKQLEQFEWPTVLDGLACTECGRCDEVCPAFQTGKKLSPKTLIHEVKEHNLAREKQLRSHNDPNTLPEPEKDLIHDILSDQFLWDCTTCGSCMEACPVFIEHVPVIISMRQSLVLMEGAIPSEAKGTMRGWETNSNPWNYPMNQRNDWIEGLEIKTLKDNPKAELLYYVGCAASYDDRNKEVAKAFIEILQTAGIDFAILGNEEKCCGETARRFGNELVGQELTISNVETLNKYGVKAIVSTCPHCYNTLKNEYPEFGWKGKVQHVTELVDDLICEGKIKVQKEEKIVVYHDSCYLARGNNVIDEPRRILQALGAELHEMSNNKKETFCCGAGGGRMWLEETEGERINKVRIQEAKETTSEIMCSSCPYCLTMFEDGMKAEEDSKIKTFDIIELVASRLVNHPFATLRGEKGFVE